LPTAPLPRPPQPISARRMVLSSAAWTRGMTTLAKLEAAAAAVPHCKNWRREAPGDDSCGDCFTRVIAFLLLEDQQTE
jgi:hypothetical protein